MASKLFVDTWGWLTLHDRKETRHQEATDIYRRFLQNQSLLYTTDYVLDETYTLLFKRLPTQKAQKSIQAIWNSTSADSRCPL